MLAGIRLSSSFRPSCSYTVSHRPSRLLSSQGAQHRLLCITSKSGFPRTALSSRRVTPHTPRTQDRGKHVKTIFQPLLPFASRPLSFDFSLSSSSANMPSLTPPQLPPKFDHTPSEITALTQEALDTNKALLDKVGSLKPEECNFNSVNHPNFSPLNIIT